MSPEEVLEYLTHCRTIRRAVWKIKAWREERTLAENAKYLGISYPTACTTAKKFNLKFLRKIKIKTRKVKSYE
jgi:hypothetical protein